MRFFAVSVLAVLAGCGSSSSASSDAGAGSLGTIAPETEAGAALTAGDASTMPVGHMDAGGIGAGGFDGGLTGGDAVTTNGSRLQAVAHGQQGADGSRASSSCSAIAQAHCPFRSTRPKLPRLAAGRPRSTSSGLLGPRRTPVLPLRATGSLRRMSCSTIAAPRWTLLNLYRARTSDRRR